MSTIIYRAASARKQKGGEIKNMNELRSIAPEIAAHIEDIYHDDAVLLDVPSPHHMAHQVAERWPGLGASFYRLVADAARECMIGEPTEGAT